MRPGGSVLDLGCGEGMVLEQIPAAERVHYTGIDLSQVAIGAAVRKISNAAVQRFICADLVTFEPVSGTTFDVVVFNEVLYYLQDPIAALLRYRAFSAPDGIVIVSVFHENRRTWKALCTLLAKQCIQQTVVSDISSSKRWYLGLYEAHPSMAAPTLSR